MRYWNIARQRYCCGSARCLRALRLSADRAENAASKPARKAGVLDPEEKVPRETDSPLEGGVSCELVSEMPNSLLAGKIQGISPIRASAAPRTQRKRARNQFLTSQFPTRPNREFFGGLQGIKSGDQGKFRPDQGIRSRPLFGPLPCRQSDRPDRSRTLPRRRTETPPDARSVEADLERGFVHPQACRKIARRARRRER